jgi:hypothetical protein
VVTDALHRETTSNHKINKIEDVELFFFF